MMTLFAWAMFPLALLALTGGSFAIGFMWGSALGRMDGRAER